MDAAAAADGFAGCGDGVGGLGNNESCNDKKKKSSLRFCLCFRRRKRFDDGAGGFTSMSVTRTLFSIVEACSDSCRCCSSAGTAEAEAAVDTFVVVGWTNGKRMADAVVELEVTGGVVVLGIVASWSKLETANKKMTMLIFITIMNQYSIIDGGLRRHAEEEISLMLPPNEVATKDFLVDLDSSPSIVPCRLLLL